MGMTTGLFRGAFPGGTVGMMFTLCGSRTHQKLVRGIQQLAGSGEKQYSQAENPQQPHAFQCHGAPIAKARRVVNAKLSDEGQRDAAKQDQRPGKAKGRSEAEIFQRQAGSDSGGMESGGRRQEAHRVQPARKILRHLRAVRVAVEERKDSHQQGPGPNWQAHGECDKDTQQQHGKQDARFHHGQIPSRHAGDSAQSHHADKTRRHHPERAAAQLRGPEADGHHGQQMIESDHRMLETVEKSLGGTRTRVGVGKSGQNQQGDDQQAFHAAHYSFAPVLTKPKISQSPPLSSLIDERRNKSVRVP